MPLDLGIGRRPLFRYRPSSEPTEVRGSPTHGSGCSDLSWEEAVRLDLRYVEDWSLAPTY